MTTSPTRRPSGRPTLTGETLKVVQVRLTADQIATARRLGNGNASEGVRRALDSMPPPMRKNGKTMAQAKAFAAAQGWPQPEDET